MKRLITMALMFLFLTSLCFGQTVESEILEVKLPGNDSTAIIIEVQSDTTNSYTEIPYSYIELFISHTAAGLMMHSALSPSKNRGTEITNGVGVLLYGGVFILGSINTVIDIFRGEKPTKERLIMLATAGVVTGSYIIYFTAPSPVNPVLTRVVNGLIALRNIHYLSKKYAGK